MIKEYNSYPQEFVDNFDFKLNRNIFSTNPFLKLLVYVEHDNIIGILLYSLIYDRVEIDQIEVLKGKKRQGIASKLLKYLIDNYKDKNIINITLEVKINNIPAIKLYKKYGFTSIAKRRKYYKGIDGILMEKKL